MPDIILHRRSFDTGSVPTTHSLGIAQFAINVPDGKVFIHKSSSVSESIVSVVTTDSITTGSITLTATASAGLFLGRFSGSFVGVDTTLISSGSATASIRYDVSGSSSLQIDTDTAISGGLYVSLYSGSTAISGTNIFGTASQAATASYVVASISKEWHVSSGSGDDTTGDGSILRPFKTIARASSSLGNTGERLVLHSGTYPESITFPQLNFTIVTVGTAQPGDVLVDGTLTFTGNSSAIKLAGFAITDINQSGNGNLYLHNISVNGLASIGGTGYFEAQTSAISQTSGILISGTGQNIFQNCKVGSITQITAATTSLLGCMTVVRPVISAGTLLVQESNVYSAASGSAALSASAASVVFLQNSSMYNPNGGAERVILGGFFGLDDVTMNRQNSVTGSSLAAKAHFQHIQADVLSGSLKGSAETASFANSGFKITSASFYSFKERTTSAGTYTIPIMTGSSNGAFLNYTVVSASNARSGQVMAAWVNRTSSFSEVITTDIGNTTGVIVSASLVNVAGDIQFTFTTPSISWSLSLQPTLI